MPVGSLFDSMDTRGLYHSRNLEIWRFQDGWTPKRNGPPTTPHRSGKKAGILASILRLFGPKRAQKRLKTGQNRRVPVTCQLAMYFCIVLILSDLHRIKG